MGILNSKRCNAPVSMATFLIGLFGSLLLIYNGNKRYKKENLIFGIFLIVIALVQFDEYLIWKDLNNKFNINKICTLISPFLIYGQPTIIYLMKLILLRNNIKKIDIKFIFMMIINVIYLLILIKSYINYYKTNIHTTSLERGHLKWPWLNNINGIYYLILLIFNIMYLTDFNYSFLLVVITYSCLILSWYYFSYHLAELWCFFGAFIPFVLFIITKYIM